VSGNNSTTADKNTWNPKIRVN